MLLRPLLRPLLRKLLRPLIAPAQRIFITLDAAQEGHYLLENPVVETGDFSYTFVVFFEALPDFTTAIIGNKDMTSDFIALTGGGDIRFNIDGNITDFTTNSMPTNLLSMITFSRVGSVGTVIINGLSQSLTVSTLTVTFNVLFSLLTISRFLSGTLANVDLGNGNAWPLDVLTGNTQQAVNGNNELTLVNIPTGAPDRELFTKNTSTDPDQWENADKSRIIPIA